MRLFEIRDKDSNERRGRPTQTQQQDPTDLPQDDILNRPFNAPSSRQPDEEPATGSREEPKGDYHPRNFRTANSRQTRASMDRAMRNLSPEQRARIMRARGPDFSRMRGEMADIDISDLEAFLRSPEATVDIDTNLIPDFHPVNPEQPDPTLPNPDTTTLPATIPTDVRANYSDVDVTWHKVVNMPRFRMPGQRDFLKFEKGIKWPFFTRTPIQDIVMMSTMVNEQIELNKVMSFLEQHGEKLNEMPLDISHEVFAGGFSGQVFIYRYKGTIFKILRDYEDGDYMTDAIFAWPEEDTNPELLSKLLNLRGEDSEEDVPPPSGLLR